MRLFTELQMRNRDLSDALEQQTATSEILRVISRSQTDVQPVFDTIVQGAVRLCDGLFISLFQFDGEMLQPGAAYNYTPEALEELHRAFPARPTRAFGAGRAILDRASVLIPAIEARPGLPATRPVPRDRLAKRPLRPHAPGGRSRRRHHGGAPGRGSAFTIRLAASVSPAGPGPTDASPAGGATVLVIDDEPAMRELMQRALVKERLRVVTAASGEEGRGLARELRPVAVTLDVMMPGMDGWAALAALKADPAVADIPVIMLTMIDGRNLGYALGASDYLAKPLDRERLAAILRKYRRDRPVLLVDDDSTARALARRTLEREGYAVIEAENGRAALLRAGETEPGLVLLDLLMPEMDGFESVAEFRKHENWRAIPVLVVTGKEISDDDRARLNGGVERALPKGTYTRESLLQEVRDLVTACIARRGGAG